MNSEFSVSQHIQMAYYLSIPLNLFSRPAQALLVCSHKKCWCSRIHVCFYFVVFISFTWTEFFVNGTELFRKIPIDRRFQIRNSLQNENNIRINFQNNTKQRNCRGILILKLWLEATEKREMQKKQKTRSSFNTRYKILLSFRSRLMNAFAIYLSRFPFRHRKWN